MASNLAIIVFLENIMLVMAGIKSAFSILE